MFAEASAVTASLLKIAPFCLRAAAPTYQAAQFRRRAAADAADGCVSVINTFRCLFCYVRVLT